MFLYVIIRKNNLESFVEAMWCSPHLFFHGWLRCFPLDDLTNPVWFPFYLLRELEHFKKKEGYAVFCPVGRFSFHEIAHLISRAVVHCRRQKIGKLLIVTTGASGFHSAGIPNHNR
jgi:hypothetical protein